MTDQEVQLFLADLAIIILFAQLLGMAAKRLGQPPVLGEIIAGILLGPTLFHGKIAATLFPITLRQPLRALANLGASAAIDDVLAWSLLAVVAAIARAGGQPLRLVLARCTRA
jgi:Kef-type K+ transport system membrane component KefB